jgi:hypothetical protein
MASVDPNIIFQIGKGVTPLLSPNDIQDQQMQREIGGYKLNALRQSAQDDADYRGVLKSGATPDQIPNKLFQAGLGKQGQEWQKFQGDQQKTQMEAQKAQVEAALKKFELSGQIMNGVVDQASWDRARQQTAQVFGPEVAAQLPPQYDPALIEENRAKAMTVKQQLEQKWKEMEYSTPNANAVLSAETARSNNAASLANSARTADMTDARAREFNASRVEENRLKREAQGTGVKLTEDQGKATGWLVQAENAFKNMQAAGFDRDGNPTSAAKPGVADAIAGVPLVGGAVGNWLRTPDRQKFVQGASSLSESLLRAATGAGVNKDEAKQKIEELTPQWGEDAETTKQKMAAIPLYIESLKVRAGPGAPKAQEISATRPVGVPKKAAGVAKPADKAAFDALPSGTLFIDPNGVTRRKP